MTEDSARAAPVRSWREALLVYTRPRVFAMIWLGFSAGLPVLLIGPTLSGWQRDVGVERSVIGFFSWIGIIYSIKVLWAPVVDRVALPLLTRWLGKRRSWMLAAQLVIAAGLLGMAQADPVADLALVAWFALLVAFGSATQDITMGVMANPFYLDLGFSKTDIADVTKIFGFFMTIAGAALGGVLVVRFGIARPLVLGAVLVALTNLLFAGLAVLACCSATRRGAA